MAEVRVPILDAAGVVAARFWPESVANIAAYTARAESAADDAEQSKTSARSARDSAVYDRSRAETARAGAEAAAATATTQTEVATTKAANAADAATAAAASSLVAQNAAAGITLPTVIGGNLLTANQASLEAGTTQGWSNFASTISAATSSPAHGAYCLAVTVTGTGAGYAYTAPNIAVTPGEVYTAVASVRAPSGETARVYLRFYDAGGTTLTQPSTAGVPVTAGVWTPLAVIAAAPAGAVSAILFVERVAGTAGAVMHVDKVGFWRGAGGAWAMPGAPIVGLGTWVDESVGRRVLAWDTVNVRPQMVWGHTGWRDVSAGLLNGWTGPLRVSRVGDRVNVRGLLAKGIWDQAYALPPGFTPGGSGVVVSFAVADQTAGVLRAGTITGAGAISIGGAAGASMPVDVSFTTTAAWPASLPGVPDGGVPSG